MYERREGYMMGTGDWERARNDHGIWAGHMSWNHKLRKGERRGGWLRKNSNGNIVFSGREFSGILNK